MTRSTLIRLCPRCGRPLAEHQVRQPAGRDPVAWDRYVSAACTQEESMRRLETAVERGVNIHLMLDAQMARSHS